MNQEIARRLKSVGGTCYGYIMRDEADQLTRRLSAVLCADVVGYSSLMHRQEEATHLAYKACLDEFIAPLIGGNAGQIVKSTGDGFIARFDSVISAVACALRIQEDLRAFQEREQIEPRLEFRLGVSSGDVIVEHGDIYGNGVNDAARLQALAKPGTICVTAGTYEQVFNRVSATFNDLGEHRLTPEGALIRVYSCRVPTSPAPGDGDDGAALPVTSRPGRSHRLAAVAIAIVLATGIAGTAWYLLGNKGARVTGTVDERAITADRAGMVHLHKYSNADLEAAIKQFKYALRIEPDFTDALIHLCDARLRQLELFQFAKLIRDADRSPVVNTLMAKESDARSKLMNQVNADLESVIASGRATASVHRALSRLRVLQGDHDSAIDHALEARELDPGNPETLANYGLALIWGASEGESARRRNLIKAEEMINRAIRLHPLGELEGNYQYAGLIAMAEYLRGDYVNAVEHFKVSVEHSGYDSQLYMLHLVAAFRQWALKSNDLRAREFRNKQAKAWLNELEQRRTCLSLGRVNTAWVERVLHYRTTVYKRRTLRALAEAGMLQSTVGSEAEPQLECNKK